jgi:hypothetical protein
VWRSLACDSSSSKEAFLLFIKLSRGLCLAAALAVASQADAPVQNWTHFVRIGAYGLRDAHDAAAIVRDAQASYVFGIEVDNDIPGRYESFLNPTAKLEAIRSVATEAHKAKNKAFVYIAGTECITANADRSPHSVVKDHPEWLQRKLSGEPAVFTSGAAFWIGPGDEDVWISPYAKDWRKIYMERVRQIAGTGIDGIYVDIPYWMTHFDGWEDSWASFDDATVAAFRDKTGLDAKKDIRVGDFRDAGFRKWIDFRIDTLTDFIREIRQNARTVNSEIMVIPEIYPGIEEESTRVGADVYEMYGVADAIAHEYEFGSGEHMASGRTQLDWFLYQAGMLTFRAFAQGKATWILNYSWDGDKSIDAREAMRNLAMSQVIAGANFWDAPGHSMAGSNDLATRKQIFEWIARYEKTLYGPRMPMQPVGVYFSPKSRDYNPQEFLESYRGTLVALLQAHREFQVLTPRTLGSFHGRRIIFPGVSVLSAEENSSLQVLAKKGVQFIVLGASVQDFPIATNTVRLENDPAATFLKQLQINFANGSEKLPKALLDVLTPSDNQIQVEAPPTVAANFAMVEGHPQIFLANFTGLEPGKNAVPTAAKNIRIRVPNEMAGTLSYLPFLGDPQIVQSTRQNGQSVFVLPALERGAVVTLGANEQ